jgi:hypothetical protein
MTASQVLFAVVTGVTLVRVEPRLRLSGVTFAKVLLATGLGPVGRPDRRRRARRLRPRSGRLRRRAARPRRPAARAPAAVETALGEPLLTGGRAPGAAIFARPCRNGKATRVPPRTSLTTRTTCRICGSSALAPVLSLGDQCICRSLRRPRGRRAGQARDPARARPLRHDAGPGRLRPDPDAAHRAGLDPLLELLVPQRRQPHDDGEPPRDRPGGRAARAARVRRPRDRHRAATTARSSTATRPAAWSTWASTPRTSATTRARRATRSSATSSPTSACASSTASAGRAS